MGFSEAPAPGRREKALGEGRCLPAGRARMDAVPRGVGLAGNAEGQGGARCCCCRGLLLRQQDQAHLLVVLCVGPCRVLGAAPLLAVLCAAAELVAPVMGASSSRCCGSAPEAPRAASRVPAAATTLEGSGLAPALVLPEAAASRPVACATGAAAAASRAAASSAATRAAAPALAAAMAMARCVTVMRPPPGPWWGRRARGGRRA